MSKYKVVGITNITLGVITISIPTLLLVFVLPKLSILYNEFDNPPSTTAIYLQSIPGLIWGIAGIFLGRKIFKEKDKKLEKYFNFALVYLVLTLLIGGIIAGLSVISVIGPIYNLTSSL